MSPGSSEVRWDAGGSFHLNTLIWNAVFRRGNKQIAQACKSLGAWDFLPEIFSDLVDPMLNHSFSTMVKTYLWMDFCDVV